MNPEDLDQLDRDARAFVGKPLLDCTATDLRRLGVLVAADTARRVADLDRANAALNDVASCECTIAVPQRPDGSLDIGRGRVRHTCGRPNE